MSQAEDTFGRAVALHRAGKIDQAEAACRRLLDGDPRHARALHLLGVIRFAAGHAAEGMSLLRQAVAAVPDYAEAHFNLAAMLAADGQTAAAATHYGECAALRPDDLVARVRHCALLGETGAIDQAVDGYRAILARWPECLPALLDAAALSFQRGDIDSAVELNRRAVGLEPGNAVALLRLGRALKEKGRLAEAIGFYRDAAARKPDYAEAHNFLAVALYEDGRLDEAERCARQAVALAPRDASARFNLGLVLQATGDIAAARTALDEAVAISPRSMSYRRGRLASLLYDPTATAAQRQAAHREFAQAAAAGVEAQALAPSPNDADPDRRLRIGWVSSDFRDHPIARNLEMLFAHRDRAAFEAVIYADVPSPDDTTQWFRSNADLWRGIAGQTDGEVARLIRDDGIDVLLFLAGHLDRNRPQIALWKAAPVQISFHDPATSGLDAMDYLLADRHLVPGHSGEWFAERVLRLPSFYAHRPIASAPALVTPPVDRSGSITFGSFNHPAKINDAVVRLWARVLAAVPASRLVLKHHRRFSQANVRGRLQRLFRAEGIEADRLVLGGETEGREAHLSRYQAVDIVLDPFPFTGSTTTFESLWMGVPVVTLEGETMVGRWSSAMLRTLKLDELVAQTGDEYVTIACRLAAEPERLRQLRSTLRNRVAASPLCAAERRARQFERLLRAAWRHSCAGRRGDSARRA